MIRQLRLLVLLTRPAVILLLALFTAVGAAQGGHPSDPVLIARAMIAVIGFLLFSVACNDLADEKIDRVNLPGQRPLATGAVTRREFAVVGLTAGAGALAVSATLGWPALAVMAGGVAISAGYSLRPVRLADRGAVASLVLPACYVAVPYLTGLLAAAPCRPGAAGRAVPGFHRPDSAQGFPGRTRGRAVRQADLPDPARSPPDLRLQRLLLGGRHGHHAGRSPAAEHPAGGRRVRLPGRALALLAALARERSARREEALISAIAIVGRGMILLLLIHLSLVVVGWRGLAYAIVIGLAWLLTAGQAVSMARTGPITRCTLRDLPAVRPAEGPAGEPDYAHRQDMPDPARTA